MRHQRPSEGGASEPAAARVRAWRTAGQAAVCDSIEPWAHGTVVRATRYPSYYDYNVVRVEDAPAMSATELVAYADQALTGLTHRRLDFDVLAAGEAVRAELVELGWRPTRLLWMRHERAPAPTPASESHQALRIELEAVPYDEVLELRVMWHREDFDGTGHDDYERHYRTAAKEVAISRGARVLAVREQGSAVAFAQLEHMGCAAEVAQVYVHPDHRGRGLGTALTRAAIDAAGDVDDLWITADDEDRAKDLYARLGFRPVWRSLEFLRVGV